MISKSSDKVSLLWILLGIPLFSYLVLHNSFNLGLYGDDWQHLYNMWRDFDVYKVKSWFDIRSYLNPYWPEYFYLGIIRHFWGFYSPAYFYASYAMRVFATISIFFLSFELTKKKMTAFLASLIYMVSVAGLQTTDWVFNMNTYAGIGLFSLALVFYLRIRQIGKALNWYYLCFIPTFALALAIVPTRMHGAVPFFLLTDLFLTFIVERQRFDKKILIRFAIPIVIFLVLVFSKSFGEGSYSTDRFQASSQIIELVFQKGYHALWFYFLGILGHLVIPDSINIDNFRLMNLPVNISTIILTSFTSIAMAALVSLSFFQTLKRRLFLPALVFNLGWVLILLWIVAINPNPFIPLNPYSPNHVLFTIALGGQFVFWAIWLSNLTRQIYPDLSSSLIISLIWIVTLTIIYWLFTPITIIEATGRYMSLGAVGFSIFFASFFTLLISGAKSWLKNSSQKNKTLSSFYYFIPIIILITWMTVNLYAQQNYLGIIEQLRNRSLTDRAWLALVKAVPKLDPSGPSIFYFTGDSQMSLYMVFTYGFFMRAGLTWWIPTEHLTPLPSTDYQELLAYVKDGSPLQKVHGRKAVPVPLSRIFAFDFRDGIVTQTTDQARQHIIEDLKKMENE